MDFDILGPLQFNNQLYGESVSRSRNGSLSGDGSGFEEMLRRTSADQTPSEPASVSSGHAVIDKDSKLYEQCVELEIFLVKTLISSMRNTVQKSGLIEEGFAGKMYEDMLYDEYARDFAINANFGMAEMAYLELTGQRGKTVIR